MATSVGARPELSVLVTHRSLSGEEAAAALNGSLKLLAPGGAEVSLEALIEHPAEGVTRLMGTPAQELEDQWYTAEFVTPALLDSEHRGVRRVSLRPTSQPLIAGVEVCWKGPESAAVVVSISEPVTWVESVGSGVTYEFQKGIAASCGAPQMFSEAAFGVSCKADASQGSTVGVSIVPGALKGTDLPVPGQRFDPGPQLWGTMVNGCTSVTQTQHP